MTGYIPTLEQIDELHRKIAPSEAAYELVHTHCVIVATIGCQIVRRQNALFTRRCTLPKDAPEWGSNRRTENTVDAAVSATPMPPTAGVTGGQVPPRLLDEHLVLIGGLLHDIGTYRVFKHDGSDGEPLKFSKKRYILHGLKGYEYLLNEGVDESIAQFLQVEAYTARAERFGEDNKRRWLDLVAKYGVPDIPALAEKYGTRVI